MLRDQRQINQRRIAADAGIATRQIWFERSTALERSPGPGPVPGLVTRDSLRKQVEALANGVRQVFLPPEKFRDGRRRAPPFDHNPAERAEDHAVAPLLHAGRLGGLAAKRVDAQALGRRLEAGREVHIVAHHRVGQDIERSAGDVVKRAQAAAAATTKAPARVDDKAKDAVPDKARGSGSAPRETAREAAPDKAKTVAAPPAKTKRVPDPKPRK